jgi:hypothetical protein
MTTPSVPRHLLHLVRPLLILLRWKRKRRMKMMIRLKCLSLPLLETLTALKLKPKLTIDPIAANCTRDWRPE